MKEKKTNRIQIEKDLHTKKTKKNSLLICGILSPLLFIFTDIIAGILWNGYSFISQSISELSAINSPTRSLVVPLNIIKDILMLIFGWSLYKTPYKNYFLKILALFLIGYSTLGLLVVFFPMHVGQSASLTNIILIALSMISFLLAIFFGAVAFKNWFRLFSIGILLYFIILAFIGLFIAPNISIGSVSTVGIQERNMLYLCLLWVLFLTIVLIKKEKK